jgi:hypothetical protein
VPHRTTAAATHRHLLLPLRGVDVDDIRLLDGGGLLLLNTGALARATALLIIALVLCAASKTVDGVTTVVKTHGLHQRKGPTILPIAILVFSVIITTTVAGPCPRSSSGGGRRSCSSCLVLLAFSKQGGSNPHLIVPKGRIEATKTRGTTSKQRKVHGSCTSLYRVDCKRTLLRCEGTTGRP